VSAETPPGAVSDPYVREIGGVLDGTAGYPLSAGAGHGTVTVGCADMFWRFDSARAEEFARLFVAASWQADVNRRMAGET